jgi:hypothetical protein
MICLDMECMKLLITISIAVSGNVTWDCSQLIGYAFMIHYHSIHTLS